MEYIVPLTVGITLLIVLLALVLMVIRARKRARVGDMRQPLLQQQYVPEAWFSSMDSTDSLYNV